MKVTLLPSALAPPEAGPGYYLTTYLINDTLAVDAGALGFWGSPRDQARVRHVFLSHTHSDHVASLPLFVDNTYDPAGEPVTVYGSEEVLDCLRRDFFNGRIWPDFYLCRGQTPFLKLQAIRPGQSVQVGDVNLTPVPVNHSVPTLGYIVEDSQSAVVIPSDTGPTQEIWERANLLPILKGVFLEAAFPDSMAELAQLSGHLTPATFLQEVKKVTRPVTFFAVHIKQRYTEAVIKELRSLNLPNLEIAQYGRPYCF